MNGYVSFALLLTASVSLCLADSDGRWPAWRGSDASGSYWKGRFPVKLSDEKNLLWKVSLPGKGCSTPVVWDDHVLLTSPDEGKDAVLAFDWNGRKLWQKQVGDERKGRHRNGSGSNPSVVTDGKSIYALFKSGNFACLDFAGKIVWKDDLTSYGKDTLYWDFGTSPILTSKHVIVALMRKNNSWLIAFDPKNGRVAWKVERNYETPPECDHSYATPTLIRHKGEEAILVWGAERLSAHSAKDGSILWVSKGFNPKQKRTGWWSVRKWWQGTWRSCLMVVVLIWRESNLVARVTSRIPTVCGRGRTADLSFPLRRWQMEKFTSCVTAARFTALTRRRAKVFGKMPFHGPARVITDHPR